MEITGTHWTLPSSLHFSVDILVSSDFGHFWVMGKFFWKLEPKIHLKRETSLVEENFFKPPTVDFNFAFSWQKQTPHWKQLYWVHLHLFLSFSQAAVSSCPLTPQLLYPPPSSLLINLPSAPRHQSLSENLLVSASCFLDCQHVC